MIGAIIIGDEIARGKRQDKHFPKLVELLRARGMRPGERWDSFWGAADNGPSGDHVVWIRLATDE